MSDQDVTVVQESTSNTGKWLLLLLAVIYVATSLYFLVDLRGRVAKLTDDQAAAHKEIGQLTERMQAAEAEAETLGQQVGITKKELAERAKQLQASQRAAEERLAKERELRGVDLQHLSPEELNQVEGSVMVKDETICIRCGLCAERCPANTITMEAFEVFDQDPSLLDREEMVHKP